MPFEWDAGKARINLRKHGVSFEEASTAFYDELSATGDDPDHSLGERRFITIGVSSAGLLLAVVHTDRDDVVRIITQGQQWPRKGGSMKKPKTSEMRAEYRRSDFSKIERGKYAKRVKASSNIVVLEPAVAAAFPNSAAVNEALQSLVEVAQRIRRPGSSRPKRARG